MRHPFMRSARHASLGPTTNISVSHSTEKEFAMTHVTEVPLIGEEGKEEPTLLTEIILNCKHRQRDCSEPF
eukprot:2096399-Amphidinium_carterae.1